MIKKLKIFDEKIRSAKNIVIFGHKNPDGDALCSVLAMASLLEQNYGKKPVCVYDGNIPDNLDNVPLRKKINFYEHINTDKVFDVAIVVDYGTARNIGAPYKFAENAKFVIEIDHHIHEQKNIGDLCFDDKHAAATTQVIYEMMTKSKWSCDATTAILLMTGIITDTGNFTFAKDARVLRVAANLLGMGVDIQKITTGLADRARKTVVVESAAAANAEFFFKNQLAFAVIDAKAYKNLDGRGETVLALLEQIRGVDYVVLLKEQKQKQIGISLRGKFKAVDKIANELGGGGHKYAAGAVVYDTLENVKKQVLDIFKKVIK